MNVLAQTQRFNTELRSSLPGDITYLPRIYSLYDQIYEFGSGKKTYGYKLGRDHDRSNKLVRNEYVLILARLHDGFYNLYFYVMSYFGDKGWIEVSKHRA